MERYNLAVLTKKIYASGFLFFSLRTLKSILDVKKESTVFSVIKKLVDAEVLVKIERSKYLLKDAKVNDFALANFIYQPSYVSFETALNFYGILSQFPYEISSTTVKKTIKKTFEGKVFTYTRVKKDLFWGYDKKDNFIIAFPEKALLDQLYISANGHKRMNLDEYDLSRLNVSRLKNYLKKFPKTMQFEKAVKKLKEHLRI